jgi:phytoene/squalene synthetase
MIYDIMHEGFKTFNDFLDYSEGAAVAPASVFIHLCGVSKEKGHYRPPKFDIKEAARPLAIFAYLVHIIRDFQKDQKNNLNYIAVNLMAENGLSHAKLRTIATKGKINPGFKKLMKKYLNHTENYRQKARNTLDKTTNLLEPRYQLSLEIIYNLYLQIFERIDVASGKFTVDELCPSPKEVQERIKLVVDSFENTKR